MAQGELLMGHGHSHGIGDTHRPQERKRLLWAMALTGSMMFVELVAGYLTNSLALIGDAGHMLTHFAALAISLGAIILAAKPSSEKKTFGFYRVEILAALLNGVFVLLISLYIFYEAYLRFISPEEIQTMEMLVVAIAGLVVNLLAAWILFDVSKEDINVKSAFIHLLGDTLSSVGIIAAAVVILFTDWYILDPLIAVIIGLVILIWAYQLISDSIYILLESVPKDVDIPNLKKCAASHDKRIKDIHDIHVWQITSGMYAMTAHVVVDDIKVSETQEILKGLQKCMSEHFKIGHITIQFELEHPCCGEEGHHHPELEHLHEHKHDSEHSHDHGHPHDHEH